MSAIHEQAMNYVYQQVLQRLVGHFTRTERTVLQLLVQRIVVAAGGMEQVGNYKVLIAHGGGEVSSYALAMLRAAGQPAQYVDVGASDLRGYPRNVVQRYLPGLRRVLPACRHMERRRACHGQRRLATPAKPIPCLAEEDCIGNRSRLRTRQAGVAQWVICAYGGVECRLLP